MSNGKSIHHGNIDIKGFKFKMAPDVQIDNHNKWCKLQNMEPHG